MTDDKKSLNTPDRTKLTPEEKSIVQTASGVIVEHPKLYQAHQAIYDTLKHNQARGELKHLMIVGDSGCGKSTLCDLLVEEFEVSQEAFQLGYRKRLDLLHASVHSPVTPRMLAKSLLRAMGFAGSLNGNSQDLTEQLIMDLGQCGVKVVILDETQHLHALGLSSGSNLTKRLRESLDWIKTVINRTRITFVLMGMPELVDLIAADPQLSRRFSREYYLSPLPMPDPSRNDIGRFVDGILLAITELPYFDGAESFSDDLSCAMRMYLATGGLPASLKELVTDAALQAYRAEDRVIAQRHFSSAFEPNRRVQAEILKIRETHQDLNDLMARPGPSEMFNPFTLPMSELNQFLRQKVA
ncbi:MAG TPA: AAA family ATPase [Gammaproteobacteria bacterium]|nr:AAA family ATPase [Gammaproteobacteria bacterium]